MILLYYGIYSSSSNYVLYIVNNIFKRFRRDILDLYKGNEYIILFLIYGLSFFSMGISAFQQSLRRVSNFPMLNSINYLALFGIVHGLTEWILMIYIGDFYHNYRELIYLLSVLTNASSFLFLFLFGIRSLEYSRKSFFINILPYVIFGLWLLCLISNILALGNDKYLTLPIFSVLSRYFIGFPGAVITAIALIRASKLIGRLDMSNAAHKIKILAYLFLIYGILAGLIVRKNIFFPATLINNMLFRRIFFIPVEMARAIAAVFITLQFIRVIEIFKEQEGKAIDLLTRERSASLERRRLAQELHDVVIQNIFAAGLQIECLIESEDNRDKKQELINIKTNLNDTIFKVRQFIAEVSKRKMGFEDLKYKLDILIDEFSSESDISINLNYEIIENPLGCISSQSLSQAYYIIQEAVRNALKHSHCSRIDVRIYTDFNGINIVVVDNGEGFNLKQTENISKGYGLISMRERALEAGGTLIINSSGSGTNVMLNIPWKGCKDGEGN